MISNGGPSSLLDSVLPKTIGRAWAMTPGKGCPMGTLLGCDFIKCLMPEIYLSQNASNRMSEYRYNNIFSNLDLDTLSAI